MGFLGKPPGEPRLLYRKGEHCKKNLSDRSKFSSGITLSGGKNTLLKEEHCGGEHFSGEEHNGENTFWGKNTIEENTFSVKNTLGRTLLSC